MIVLAGPCRCIIHVTFHIVVVTLDILLVPLKVDHFGLSFMYVAKNQFPFVHLTFVNPVAIIDLYMLIDLEQMFLRHLRVISNLSIFRAERGQQRLQI